MAAISTTKHYKLTNDIKGFLSNFLVPVKLKPCLQTEAMQLQGLYENYKCTLLQLQVLIKEYDTMQRKIKVELRKQQIIKAKQKICGLI